MPIYNCAEFLPYSIHSISIQTFGNFEFLIIDDGSTDDSQNLISKFRDNRINYVIKEHSGLADSLNYGLKIAKYDIIARMDADDIAHPNRLKKQLSFYKANPQIDIFSSWYTIFSGSTIQYIVKTPTDHFQIIKGLSLYSYISHPGCIYNRNVLLKAGGYSAQVYEDYELWLRLMNKVIFGIIPEVLIFQRYRKDSLSRGNVSVKNKIHYQIQQKYFDSLNSYFTINNTEEENSVRGWREYFYGGKKEARRYWRDKNLFLTNWKIFLAFFFTFLPDRMLVGIKELRLRYRLKYFINYFTKENRVLRDNLKMQLNQRNDH